MNNDKTCTDCAWWGYCHRSEEHTDMEPCERFREREREP